ncbi:MAG: 2-oxoacid:acceptor oxidoreductase subunit alpha [Sedimentisphaerales bacterium]|jgi:2-oxoglutarate ferredoxin oxidoreductase subunit alpha|nr:2-oxoacid:acceptor oxidoreductase subunit alpha [Sedimentisphaerales bacterium]HNY79146.1 2-oxoacid:acceptor oxidoreductase subunit alpha [Sedimentisphaerales bacterium]HOC64188.1 2-oxoacid:acceptor oxidoreductase subunit alpha [Sedimentisphaerales bacterium]HOH65054.1 2-oxoacid:acceptor oxidoreductase subunit alpha [Sedimentisphaerales bacterium]HQA90081.1 2-oxoacid:acceptor oxidoreductase subunit alpha [Sedimentisphaerales bacterium]
MRGTQQAAKKHDVSVVLCGQAGQGVQTVEHLVTRILKAAGYHVFATKEYMSRVRGGANSTTIRVCGRRVAAPVSRMDILVPLNKGAVAHVAERLSPETVLVGEREVVGDDDVESQRFLAVPFTQIASDIGGKIYSNVVAVGAIAGLLGLDLDAVVAYVRRFFAKKTDDIVANNVKAVQAGYDAVGRLDVPDGLKLTFKPSPKVADEMLLSGAEAVGLGAIAGGCNFVSSYPMSPSTNVLTFLAQHGLEQGVLAEQAEDEIAAINMAIGAAYAGARALVTTSGGGFALMTEGVSLAGMLECPVVIHLAQRPGPATGLPTRTEQADLELALYAGHGEFPRILFAPGTLEQAFYLTQRAFNLADKYQVPAFILTDEYLIDSYYNFKGFDLSKTKAERHIVKTTRDYRRYKLTKNGISPRGIPGYGEGLVAVDSDEHDEEGHITEDLNVRVAMVDKRLAKGEALRKDVVRPELIGPKNYKRLVICWGSTYHIVQEALAEMGRTDTAMLHYSQVYPLHPSTADLIRKARRTVVVEGNATGQFRKLIRLHAGVDVDEALVKYDGLGFTVEDVVEGLTEIISR